MYINKGNIDRIIDSSLNGETTPHSLKYFAELAIVANKCLHTKPKERPTMAEVVQSLDIALESFRGRLHAKAFWGIKIVPKVLNRWWRAWKGNGSNDGGGPILVGLNRSLYPRFSLAEICAATNGFSDGLLIGQHSSFRLYKGCMGDGTRVVIIKLYESRRKSASIGERVSDEIGVQYLTRHPNIVSLIGFCEEKHELILVYDYMVNGTLQSHLYETDMGSLLWKKRLEICIGIARGLEYLHTNVEQQFVHCDIKALNVLLDNEWVAKIGNFELALPIPTSMATEGVKTIMRGTRGYVAPEFLTGKVTTKADVYSFGLLLLEVLWAKRVSDCHPNYDTFFWKCIKRGTIDEVIDPYLIGKIAPECFRHYFNIALSCLAYEGIRRPFMNDVLSSLQSSLEMQEAWENSVQMRNEWHTANITRSYNDVISIKSEFTIGGQSYLISDLVRPWSPVSSPGYSSSSE